jgi:hypothetical protein
MQDRVCALIKMNPPNITSEGYLFGSGSSVPSGAYGYQPGAIFQDTTNGVLYVNEGTLASCTFAQISALTAAQEALLGATAGTVAASKAVIVDAYKTLRWGGFNTGAALTDAVPFSTVPNTWSDGQLDILAVFGGTGADLTGLDSAKCGRFRHVNYFSGTQNGEVYGLVGQLVAKTVVLGLYSAGLMGTIESNGGFHAGKGTTSSYPVHAGVIGRPGGASITVDSNAVLAGIAALSNTTSITASAGPYVGVYVAKCQSSCDAFGVGVKIADSAATTGIEVGTCTTGISITGAAQAISAAGTITSATPDSTRLIRSELTVTPAATVAVGSNGSLAAVRGCMTLTTGKSITDGYLYGVQGKFVGDGATIDNGSDHIAGIYAQMSGSSMVVTSGHVAVVIASGQNLPTSSNVDMIYCESGNGTVNSVLKSNVKATYLLDVSNFESCGIISEPTGATHSGNLRAIKVQLDGATYYILAAAVISA